MKSNKILYQIVHWSIHGYEPTTCTKSYLRNIAKACLEVAQDPSPSPKMLRTIQGIFQLAPSTIDQLERDQIKA
jgi:hypothetical protein